MTEAYKEVMTEEFAWKRQLDKVVYVQRHKVTFKENMTSQSYSCCENETEVALVTYAPYYEWKNGSGVLALRILSSVLNAGSHVMVAGMVGIIG
jgi:hypothetical protein